MRKYIFLAGTLALLLAGCGTSAPEQTEALTSIAAYPETMHLTVGSHSSGTDPLRCLGAGAGLGQQQ